MLEVFRDFYNNSFPFASCPKLHSRENAYASNFKRHSKEQCACGIPQTLCGILEKGAPLAFPKLYGGIPEHIVPVVFPKFYAEFQRKINMWYSPRSTRHSRERCTCGFPLTLSGYPIEQCAMYLWYFSNYTRNSSEKSTCGIPQIRRMPRLPPSVARELRSYKTHRPSLQNEEHKFLQFFWLNINFYSIFRGDGVA